MQYGLYEIRKNIISLIKTKIFYKNARLIRYPFFLRNKKNVSWDKGFTCGYNCRIESIIDENHRGIIKFGKNVKIGDYVHISSAESITIGDNVLIASHVFISDLDHGIYTTDKCDVPFTTPDKRLLHAKKIEIGNNVWIGENVVILKGVNIGDGCVIGANSLVTHDINKNCIAYGSPAKCIKIYDSKKKGWVKANEV